MRLLHYNLCCLSKTTNEFKPKCYGDFFNLWRNMSKIIFKERKGFSWLPIARTIVNAFPEWYKHVVMCQLILHSSPFSSSVVSDNSWRLGCRDV